MAGQFYVSHPKVLKKIRWKMNWNIDILLI